MKRRSFLKMVGITVSYLSLYPGEASGGLIGSPVTVNRLRPPGAVPEEIFPAKCIRCGRCVEICSYRAITLLDIRAGIHAGTPLIAAEKTPCYLCMKCVDVCPTGSLERIQQKDTRMGLAVINRFTCLAWVGTTLCRTCYDKCPFKEIANRLDQFRPVVDENQCTGCGLCTHACPVTAENGSKAVNIEPIYAREKVTG